MRTARALALLLAITMSGPSCSWFRRKPKTPPPPAPAPPITKPAAEPPPMPTPPPIEPSASATPPPSTVITPPPPIAKPPAEKKATAPKPVVRPPATVETPPADSQSAAAPPQLMQILTPAEQRFYTSKIDESLRRARRNLDVALRRKLTASQQGIVERIRVFLTQADEARARDLVTAHSLATRADVLAQELAKGGR